MTRVLDYLPELDAFLVADNFKAIADELGLTEWHEAVWVGRYLTLDNDYGEHIFDNWELREARQRQAAAMGVEADYLMIVDPSRFQNSQADRHSDGPCHTDEERKRFWTDVLRSLHLSLDTIIAEARRANERRKQSGWDEPISDLEERIARVRERFGGRETETES
ncbi:MAG: hypothetical protein WA958_11660 [Tunicatimonas sp.]